MTKRLSTRLLLTPRTLNQRIQRRLRHDGQHLRASRSSKTELQVGRFYIVDVYHHHIVQTDVDPETLARDLGILRPWEQVAAEE
jgi:hypothetical protein